MSKLYRRNLRGISKSGPSFSNFAKWVSSIAGHPSTFFVALMAIVAWAAMGPSFDYSNTWQLGVNTGTTILTFLMVFLIQNTQNRDAQAMQIKLDELLRCDPHAHSALLDLEELTERELLAIKDKYEEIAESAREMLRQGKSDKGSPEILLEAVNSKK